MNILFKNKPQIKEKNAVYLTAIIILTLITIVPMITPVMVCLINGFSTTESTADNAYYIFRGISAVALIFGVMAFTINKKFSSVIFPALICFIMSLFPLVKSINTILEAVETAEQLSMTIDYTLYIVDIGLYTFLTLLSLATALFAMGTLKSVVTVMVLSIVSSMAAIFLAYDRYVTFEIPLYDVMCAAYVATLALIPTFVVLSAKITRPAKAKKYEPRRIKE